jgi:hypothetical protein
MRLDLQLRQNQPSAGSTRGVYATSAADDAVEVEEKPASEQQKSLHQNKHSVSSSKRRRQCIKVDSSVCKQLKARCSEAWQRPTESNASKNDTATIQSNERKKPGAHLEKSATAPEKSGNLLLTQRLWLFDITQ